MRPQSFPARIVLLTIAAVSVCGLARPDAILRIEDQAVFLRSQDVALPIRLSNEEGVYGVQLSIVTDPVMLAIDLIETTGAIAEGAEFSAGIVTPDRSAVSWGMVLDISFPLDESSFLPPGENHLLAFVVVVVVAPAAATTTVRFEDRPEQDGLPAAFNRVVRDEGVAVPLDTFDGVITIVEPPPGEFVRGNANGDANFDLSDGVFTLNFLFNGGAEPPCLDAADTTDDGEVDLSDSVYSFNALFLGGPPPSLPYPGLGVDPTVDVLDCLVSQR
jgi:hypothetical protein